MENNDVSIKVDSPAVLLCNVVNIPNGSIVDYQWRKADISSVSRILSEENSIYLPYVNVSDAGVYICEVIISDPSKNPNVICQSGSVNVTLSVISK